VILKLSQQANLLCYHTSGCLLTGLLHWDFNSTNNMIQRLPLNQNKKHLKNVVPIRHCELPHADVQNNNDDDSDNA